MIRIILPTLLGMGPGCSHLGFHVTAFTPSPTSNRYTPSLVNQQSAAASTTTTTTTTLRQSKANIEATCTQNNITDVVTAGKMGTTSVVSYNTTVAFPSYAK